jgi:DNA-binding SARP family transcriptional activator/Flp pilus assembly protein TadD
VETTVGGSVETPVESVPPSESLQAPSLELRMLGPLAIRRRGAVVELPASRKVRALIAYLALASQPVARTQLCELLWDLPDDPKGELRWCLSKIRNVVDEPGRRRVETQGDTVRLDVADCYVDAIEIARATQTIETLSSERLRVLATSFTGDFLGGLEIDGNPVFNGWLIAQRRRFRCCHAALLEHLAKSVPDEEAFGYVQTWLELSPFDRHAHEALLNALARRDLIREGEEHVAAAVRLFEAEGLDSSPMRDAWRSARARASRFPDGPVAQTQAVTDAATSATVDGDPTSGHRASVAVMPFTDSSAVTGIRGGIADALAHDVITRLAKLRSLFVIAQGSVFALHERHIGSEEAGRILDVDYVTSGSVRRQGKRINVTIELTETRTARIVWAEIFNRTLDNAFGVLDEIGDSVVASIAGEIEANERKRAVLKPPSSLNAWEAHHRGLWHMYRFTKDDNDRAAQFFDMAVRLDPTFARAYAGLSFTHFQNAFQGWTPREPATSLALETAGQSLMVDDRDPAAHWSVGRALWLRGSFDQAVTELEQAIELSPNFALGQYTLAFVHSQSGDPHAAIAYSDLSRRLSPFDPLLFGMLASRAMALVRLGRFEEAAEWAVRGAARPNAHAHILAIAAYSLALAGRLDEARTYLSSIRKTQPHYGVADLTRAFHYEPGAESLFRSAAKKIGAP